MALERRSASQICTFSPPQPSWTFTVRSAGLAGTQNWAVPFTGLTYVVGGIFSAGTPITVGDQFQLYTTGVLKESTIFTVAGVTPSVGFSAWNVFFTPAPQVLPTVSDTFSSLTDPKNPRWLGALGHVSGLAYSYTMPGGPDQMSCLLRLPPNYRTDALNPGRVVQIWRGASCVWEGKLNEPSPDVEGWTVTAHGAGTYGGDFMAAYSTWNADDPIEQAITRGLRWIDNGIGTPSGIYLGQQQDSGSLTIASFLDLLCTGGALLWTVTRGIASAPPAGAWQLSVIPFPTDANGNPTSPVDRIIVSSSPAPRTVAADINNVVVRFQATPDIAATSTKAAKAATYSTAIVGNTASISQHGPMEYYLDLSSAGVMTPTAAEAVAANVLSKYVRASFAGPFTVGPGQLLNAGGVPVDLGCEEAGSICQLMVTDAPYGGEVAAAPLTFMTGRYEFDDDSDTAVITPYQSARQDFATLFGALHPGKF